MSAYNIDTLQRILAAKHVELTKDTIDELPEFMAMRAPTVVFVCNGDGLDRWLVFGQSPHADRLEIAPLPAATVIEWYSHE